MAIDKTTAAVKQHLARADIDITAPPSLNSLTCIVYFTGSLPRQRNHLE
jgi:hypothetical protein